MDDLLDGFNFLKNFILYKSRKEQRSIFFKKNGINIII